MGENTNISNSDCNKILCKVITVRIGGLLYHFLLRFNLDWIKIIKYICETYLAK